MSRSLSYAAVLLFAIPVIAGCAAKSSSPVPVAAAEEADEIKTVELPKELVGKWRHESSNKETKATKTLVYHFMKGGWLEVEAVVKSPDLNTTDVVMRAVTKLDGDKVSVMDISRTGPDGVEDVIPKNRRRTRTYQFQVKGDELKWTEVDEAGKPTPMVLKKVKEEKK